MDTSVAALLVLAVTLGLFFVPRLPLATVTVLSVLAMGAVGAVPWTDALAGFAGRPVFLVIGMMVIGQAIVSSGLAWTLSRWLLRWSGVSSKKFILILMGLSAVLSIVLNPVVVVALMMPVIDDIARRSKARVTRKEAYFPMGVATTLGSNLTTFSSTSMVFTMGLLESAGYGTLDAFGPALVNLPALIVIFVLYGTIGLKLQGACFNFEEQAPEFVQEDQSHKVQPIKAALTLVCVVVVVLGMAWGVNIAVLSLAATVFLILTGCVDEREALAGVSWHAVVIVGASAGMAEGVRQSGAGDLIAHAIVDGGGWLCSSPLGLCIVLAVACSVLSNLLSDTGTLAIMLPIAFSLSQLSGIAAVPLALVCAAGAKVAIATPISVTHMTMVQVVGYRFKDYLLVGGVINLICVIVTSLAIGLVYF